MGTFLELYLKKERLTGGGISVGVGGLSPWHVSSLFLRKNFAATSMVQSPSKHSSVVNAHTPVKASGAVAHIKVL